MATWTLKHGSTTQSLKAWGFSDCVLTDRGWAPATFQWTHAGTAFDAEPLFGKDDEITLYYDGVKKFIGFITQTPAHAADTEDQAYVAENLLGDMARRVFGQIWQNLSAGTVTGGFNARVVLFDDDGAAQNVALTLAAVVNAAASAGVSVQMGTAENLTVSPRKLDVKSMNFLEVLRAACVYSPDVVPQVDYTTEPPTLNFIRRVDATAHDVPVIGAADDFSITPHYDQQVAGVYLVYETRGSAGGTSYLSLGYDIYPEGTTATGRRVLFAVQRLQGAAQTIGQKTTQEITTATVDEEDIEWWKTRATYLQDANAGATITDVTVLDEEGAATTVHRELRSGVIYPWMGGTNEVVIIKGIFNGVINGSAVVNQAITIRMVSTTLGSGEYNNTTASTPSDSTPDEPAPAGVAEHLYSALHPLQWSGTRTLIETECSATIRAGDVVNFTGTANEAWETARAQIQEVEMKLDTGATTITFGPPQYLGPQDFTELLRDQRKLIEGNSSGMKASGESGGSTLNSEGPTWSAETSISLGPAAILHPWKITKVGLSGNTFRVEGGLYDGYPIAAVTTDIGATRPRYIYISAQWTVTAWATRFAATAERTADPTIASSTTLTESTMVLPTGTTTAKRLLGVIAAGDLVTQYATADIAPVWEDNGSLAGEAALDHD